MIFVTDHKYINVRIDDARTYRMSRGEAIGDLLSEAEKPDTCPNSQSAFFAAFAVAGYVVIAVQSADDAVTLSLKPGIDAVVIDGTRCQSGISLAEKVKNLTPELPIVLICPESQMNDPLPPWVDAGTCSDTPESAVFAITAFSSTRCYAETCGVA